MLVNQADEAESAALGREPIRFEHLLPQVRIQILMFLHTRKVGGGSILRPQDQIIRFGGDTDPSLPWPLQHTSNSDTSMEKPLGGTRTS